MSETKAVLCQTCGHMHERVQECQQPSNHSVCSAEHRAQLWDAINEYAEACGATPGARIYGNTKRQRAVAEIEALVYPINEKGQPMSRHGPKEIERIKRIAARMTPPSQAQGSSAEPSGSASDLPGCIRRELQKMRAQYERLGLPPGDPECNEAIAFMRWAKRLSGDDLSSAILTVMNHCVRDRTCLSAKLAEAARRLRQNAELSHAAKTKDV